MTVNNDGVEVERTPVEFDANIDQIISLVETVRKGVPEPVVVKTVHESIAAEMRDNNARGIINKLEHIVGKENAEILLSNYTKLAIYAEQQRQEPLRMKNEVVSYNRGVDDSIDCINFYARN